MAYPNYPNYPNFNSYPYQTSYPNNYSIPGAQQPQQNVYAFVNGVEGAKSYQVQPNQTVLLMDSEQPVCYMKTANALGQGVLRYFKLSEVTEADLRANASTINQSVALDKNEEFVSLKKQVEELTSRISKLEPKGE